MDTDGKGDKYRNIRIIISVIKVFILIGIVAGIPLYVYFCHGDWIKTFESLDDIVALINHYKGYSILVYILLQIVQIIISVLPGQAFQIAAGYLFGPFASVIYAMTGAIIGTAISFMLAKLLGRDMVHVIFSQDQVSYYVEKLNSKKAYVIVFLIYLIPGIPKDMVSYIAGISEMKFKPFIVLSALGRLPGMLGSILIGTLLYHEIYVGVGIVAVIAVLSFLMCVICRKKIFSAIDRLYEKLAR